MLLASLITPLILVTVVRASSRTLTYSCPPKCRCTPDFLTVNCDRLDLSEIPKGIPQCVEKLILSHNNFGIIPDDGFSTLPHLTSLHLDGSQITELKPHAFRGLPKLKEIFLLQNSIESISEREFCDDLPRLAALFLDRNNLAFVPNLGGCTELETLTIENNQLHSLKFHEDYKNVTKLKSLTLSLNPIGRLRAGDFTALRKASISRLLLSRINLKTVEDKTFEPLARTLTTLKLAYNPLNGTELRTILAKVSSCKQLLSIDVDGLELNGNLPTGLFDNFSNITSLSLNNNNIGTVHAGVFRNLNHLTQLSLKNSNISKIESSALKGMKNLQYLYLGKNSLKEIASHFPQKLIDLDLDGNGITRIGKSVFAQLTELKNLQLSHNSIEEVDFSAFTGLNNLETLNLYDNLISDLDRKTFSSLKSLKKLSLRKNKLVNMTAHVFEDLNNLQDLDFSENGCRNLPYLTFSNLTSLQILNLGHNLLNSVLVDDNGGTFEDLDDLLTLQLNNNDLEALSPMIFKHLTKLVTLNLSHNWISQWSSEVFTFVQNLNSLDLSHNKIVTIDKFSLGGNMSRLQSLNLDDNPFACTCDLVWFCRWLNGTKVNIVHYTNYTCESPRSVKGLKIVNFDWYNLNCFDYYPYVIAAGAVGGILLVVLIVVLLYRCRWRISLCCYLTRVKLHPSRADYQSIPGDDLNFDAYISSVKRDCPFVERIIIRNFDSGENDADGRYTLFFEPRNVRVGQSIISNIIDAINGSPRAIIILTKQYLRNARSRMELDYIYKTSLQRSLSLIFVTYDGSVSLRTLPKWLHNAYKSGEFLVWNSEPAAEEEFLRTLEKKLQRPPPMHGDQEAHA